MKGKARTLFEGLLCVCIGWMFFSFFTQELVTFGDRVIYSRHFARHQYYEYPPEVERLPKGATIVNLDGRAANYPLVGSGHTNRVVTFLWSLRTFGIDVPPKALHNLTIDNDAKGVFLDAKSLRTLGATHLYARTKLELTHDACVGLEEVGRLDRNKLSGARLDPPKVLYRINYCDR